MAGAIRAEIDDDVEVRINLRIARQDRDLIDRAATAAHKNRTEFMLDSARQAAVDTLLDQTFFPLDSQRWGDFMAALNQPVLSNPRFKALLSRKAPWEK